MRIESQAQPYTRLWVHKFVHYPELLTWSVSKIRLKFKNEILKKIPTTDMKISDFSWQKKKKKRLHNDKILMSHLHNWFICIYFLSLPWIDKSWSNWQKSFSALFLVHLKIKNDIIFFHLDKFVFIK